MQTLGTVASGRVRLYDSRRVINPEALRREFAALPPRPEAPSARSKLDEVRRCADPEALRVGVRLVYGLDRRSGSISRWDSEDFRFRDPAALKKLVGLLAGISFADAAGGLPERARLELELARVYGDATGRWRPYEASGETGASGWLCVNRENADGGRFSFRAGAGSDAWCQKELSPGYLAVADEPVEWRMSPVFSWDRHYDGAIDLVTWRATPLAALAEAPERAPSPPAVLYSSL
jgi:hypothetical protein